MRRYAPCVIRVWINQIVLPDAVERRAELDERREGAPSIFWFRPNPEIKVLGVPRLVMEAHGPTADQQTVNVCGVEGRQQNAEI